MNLFRTHRDRVWDVAAIAFSLFIAISVAVLDEELTGSRLTVSLVVGIAGSSLLWWRRRWPIEVAVALALCTMITDVVAGAELVAIFTVASYRSWRVSAAVVALHVVAAVVWTSSQPGESVVLIGIFSAAVLSIPAAWGSVIKARREVIDSLRERAERAESEAALRAETVRGLERERIAREMHDALAHRISLVSLHAGALEVRPDVGPQQVESLASTIRTNAHGALEDLREILGVLRSDATSPVRPQPGLSDITALFEDSAAAGTPVNFVDEMPPDLAVTPSVARTVHRVIQEGLTNARKHAPGMPVQGGIELSEDRIRVWLENGVGTVGGVEVPGSRSGIIGLTERVGLAGGRIEHGVARSGTGVVYRLEAWLPCPT